MKPERATLFGLALLAPCLLAQDNVLVPAYAAKQAVTRPTFGTASVDTVQVHASSCGLVQSDTVLESTPAGGFIYRTAGWPYIRCGVDLPNGVVIDGVQAWIHDSGDAVADYVSLGFGRCPSVVGVVGSCFGHGVDAASIGTSFSPQTDYITVDLTGEGLVVDKRANSYFAVVGLFGDAGSAVRFRNLNVNYHRQVSAAPESPTFTDVPLSHPFFRFIEALAASGITSGCGSGNFCPERNVTRGEIAVFIARALGLHFPY